MLLNAQVTDKVPSALQIFREYPVGEMRNFGIGSYGFDALENRYNPQYDSLDASFYFSTGGNLTLSGDRQFEQQLAGYDALQNYQHSTAYLPSFTAKLQYYPFQLHAGYHNEVLYNRKLTNTTETLAFSSQTVIAESQTHEISQNSLYLALSMQTSPTLSITLGAFSRSFRHQWDVQSAPESPRAIEAPAKFSSSLFNNLQYLFSTTWQMSPRAKSYLTFQTQKSQVSLTEDQLRLDFITSNFSAANVGYYGHVGYGLSYKMSDKILLSLELRHQFLEESDTTFAARSAGVGERHIWNNEIILGSRWQASNAFTFGALFSYYYKYDNVIYPRFAFSDGSSSGGEEVLAFAHINQPWALVFSGQYQRGNFFARGFFQWASAEYQLNDGSALVSDPQAALTLMIGWLYNL